MFSVLVISLKTRKTWVELILLAIWVGVGIVGNRLRQSHGSLRVARGKGGELYRALGRHYCDAHSCSVLVQ